jgi:hypothetical protein
MPLKLKKTVKELLAETNAEVITFAKATTLRMVLRRNQRLRRDHENDVMHAVHFVR